MIVFLEAQGTNANNRYAMYPAGKRVFYLRDFPGVFSFDKIFAAELGF